MLEVHVISLANNNKDFDDIQDILINNIRGNNHHYQCHDSSYYDFNKTNLYLYESVYDEDVFNNIISRISNINNIVIIAYIKQSNDKDNADKLFKLVNNNKTIIYVTNDNKYIPSRGCGYKVYNIGNYLTDSYDLLIKTIKFAKSLETQHITVVHAIDNKRKAVEYLQQPFTKKDTYVVNTYKSSE